MEVKRDVDPNINFLKEIRKITKKKGIVLIFDECTSGFRENFGGLHLKYKINPDMAMFGKALGNGYPITAILGKKGVMNSIGKTFISSTYWTENTGTAAAIKTLNIMKRVKSWKIITSKGKKIKKEFKRIADKHKLGIKIKGIDALPGFEFEKKNTAYQNFICKEMLKRGFLFKNNVYLSITHSEKMINSFIKNLDEIFFMLKKRKIKDINSLNDFKRMN